MHMTICLMFAWFLIYLCVMKGIKSSGKASFYKFVLFMHPQSIHIGCIFIFRLENASNFPEGQTNFRNKQKFIIRIKKFLLKNPLCQKFLARVMRPRLTISRFSCSCAKSYAGNKNPYINSKVICGAGSLKPGAYLGKVTRKCGKLGI